MKAVVIAGGFGTRLRPLSCTRPKHLFPIAGKPLMDWTLQSLSEASVNEVVFALNYMSEAFAKRYGESAFGMKIHYSLEEKPLGTGGCVKNAERIIGQDEPFLLLNGDILSKIDYADLLARHTKNKAAATIALHWVRDPSRYGVVEIAHAAQIKRFVEKPSRGKAPSNLINAGVYALSPEVFDYVAAGRRVSIEREVFPTLARDGKLYGYRFDALWIDVGEPADYLKSNRLLLESELTEGKIAASAKVKNKVEVRNPIAIGEKATVATGSRIGPYVTLDNNVYVGRDANLENSIIFSGTTISDHTSIKGAIIGEGVVIGKSVKIKEKCIIGDYAIIHDKVSLARGVTVCPQKEVTQSVLSRRCLQ